MKIVIGSQGQFIVWQQNSANRDTSLFTGKFKLNPSTRDTNKMGTHS